MRIHSELHDPNVQCALLTACRAHSTVCTMYITLQFMYKLPSESVEAHVLATRGFSVVWAMQMHCKGRVRLIEVRFLLAWP